MTATMGYKFIRDSAIVRPSSEEEEVPEEGRPLLRWMRISGEVKSIDYAISYVANPFDALSAKPKRLGSSTYYYGQVG